MIKINYKKNRHINGFTIIELLVVIVIIGVLSAITFVSYGAIQARAKDTSVLSDLDTMDALQTSYGLGHNTSGKAYYSVSGVDADLGFTPSSGNIIDVVTNNSEYCIRGYNLSGTKNSIFNAQIIESTVGVCNTINPSSSAVAAYTGPKVWLQISSASSHSCGLASNYQVYCWGTNTDGQLGNNSTTRSLVPVAVSTTGVLSGKTIKSIAVGYAHSCAIDSDEKAYCWGSNAYGELGDGTTTQSLVPVAVNTSGVLSGKTIKSIGPSGWYATCALASDNQVYCWGNGGDGNLGNGTQSSSSIPVAVNTAGVLSGKTVKTMTVGGDDVCVVASNNLVYCWAYNGYGEMGNNTTGKYTVPVAAFNSGVLNGVTIKAITAVNNSTCVLTSDNKAYCSGYGVSGKIGDGSASNTTIPLAINMSGALSGKTINSIATSGSSAGHFCAIASDSKAYCWGYNGYGGLGNNTTTQSNVPVAVDTSGVLSGKTIKSITMGSIFTCSLASDNQAYCWGSNSNGQLGNNSTTNSSVPVLVRSAP